MRAPGAQDAYRLAWRHLGRLPEGLGRGLLALGGDAAWAWDHLRGGSTGVGQLRRNLARVAPGPLGPRALDTLTRQAVRSYTRYFYEALTLPSTTPGQLRHRLRANLDPCLREDLARGSLTIALPHMGNWDLTAAWACAELGRVVTVAERLEPPDLFEQFVAFRESLGVRVIGQGHGEKVFDQLLAAAQEAQAHGRHEVFALLADRDLSSSGVEVVLCGHRARVAAGPAALALRTGTPLYVGTMSYERLTGQRRRLAGSRWGTVLTVRRVPTASHLVGRERVEADTRAWARVLSSLLPAHAVDWHMLQAVFTDDLDAARLARRHATEAAAGALGATATTSTETATDHRDHP